MISLFMIILQNSNPPELFYFEGLLVGLVGRPTCQTEVVDPTPSDIPTKPATTTGPVRLCALTNPVVYNRLLNLLFPGPSLN